MNSRRHAMCPSTGIGPIRRATPSVRQVVVTKSVALNQANEEAADDLKRLLGD